MRPSTIKFVFIIVLLSPDCITAQWKTFLEVDAPEGQPEGFIVYNKFPQPTAGEVYVLFYAQKGDSLDKVGLFKVSPSGIVTTAQKLIYEKGKANKYDLTIVKRPRDAKNGGLATTIRVKVQDVNNFPPLFTFALYNGTIREDSPSDTVVMGLENCHAEERDTSGIRAYRIVKGNEKGYLKAGKREVAGKSFLQLKATGKPIQRSKTGAYMTLIVEAEDMGNPPLTGRTSVRVWIEEVNNYAPAFDKKSYERTISEDTPKMMSLLRVQATDKDDGVSGKVYYFFQTLSSFFTINPFTGIITLVRELDYSQSDQRLHQLSIVARDAGNPAKESSATVTISVDKDVPNFPFSALSSSSQENTAPFFPKAAYHFTFQASFPVKGSLGAVVAVDMDPPGPNSDLRYSLVSVSDKFSVDTFSGVLTVSKTVNVGTYTMMVRAQDQGNPSKQAQGQIKVEVEDFDYSHNYPVFSNPIQEINVNENTAIGTSVFQAAVVSDSSISKGVVYSAISGSALPYFEVDEATGVMKTASPLDRERHGVYDMLIEARNKEKLPRHSYLYVIIEITNKDDAYPDFTKAAYDASVPEGSPKETFVTVIHAIDKDDPVITYSIPSSPSPFEIESRTGVIRTKRVLDRAMGDNEFMVYVVANDGGGKSSETIVRVNVTSAHNSAPKFQKDSYDVSLKEGQGLVPNLLCIAATGSDGVVKYAMKKGGDHRFQVDQDTGRFSIMDSFNYMSERGFVVQVEARSESSSQVALASVSVNIKNDDGPPAFLTKSYDITTLENVAVGTKLLVDDNGGFRFSTDGKPSTDFDCTLEDITKVQIIDHFKVERANSECQLQVIKTFVETPTREYKFDVRVTNVKQRNLFATAAVTVKITDTNDFPPEFVQSSYWVTVPTTTPSGTSLLQVIALDRDNEGNPDIVLDLLSEGAQDDLSRLVSAVVRRLSFHFKAIKMLIWVFTL
ncbi:protocadherin-like protein [Montipora foliosa]|uniref:protocadherin-like protein n=1 Tax=Montipora foliosa TaxID=591990 RepID=UPI0035F15E4D